MIPEIYTNRIPELLKELELRFGHGHASENRCLQIDPEELDTKRNGAPMISSTRH
ncbi:MAG: hypothetical protein WD097_01725 [Balneolales bacterium]